MPIEKFHCLMSQSIVIDGFELSMSMAITRFRMQAFSYSHAKNTLGHLICVYFDEGLK